MVRQGNETDVLLNVVERQEVENELGPGEWRRLIRLYRWLCQGPVLRQSEHVSYAGSRIDFDADHQNKNELAASRITFRSAPSIVVRSEAELFGINMPRFAHRATLGQGESNVGFVNLRRINSFVKSVTQRLDVGANREFLNHLQANCRCIADSFLHVPEWLSKKGYHLITTQLERWYGEPGENEGTVFVTHFPFGGGMCAQATCFMATALLHEHAQGVHGVAEVTVLAAPGRINSHKFLNFSGLSPDDLARYFRHPEVGLHALVQRANSFEEFTDSVRDYVFSNCPVVIPVDMREFKKPTGLYRRVGWERSSSDRQELHAVLVVGASQSKEKKVVFVIHDPAALPYLEVPAEELFAAATMAVAAAGGNAQFIPVTPNEAQIPLRQAVLSNSFDFPKPPSNEAAKRQEMEQLAQISVPGISNYIGGAKMGEWRLVALLSAHTAANFQHLDSTLWEKLCKTLGEFGPLETPIHMAWLFSSKTDPMKVSVLPALNKEPDGGTLIGPDGNKLKPLELKLNSSSGTWESSKSRDDLNKWLFSAWGIVAVKIEAESSGEDQTSRERENGATDESKEFSELGKLQLSLISSFSVKNRREAESNWNHLNHSPKCEQYLWLQGDVLDVVKFFANDPLVFASDSRVLRLTSVDAMALIQPGGPLAKMLVRSHVRGPWARTAAIATFILEISADPGSMRALQARQAIRLLGWLALKMQERLQSAVKKELNLPQGQDAPQIKLRIELVAGSLIDKVFQSLSPENGRPELIASLMPVKEAHKNIAENLHLALTKTEPKGPQPSGKEKDSDLCNQLKDKGICFALEQEPGPLFSLEAI